METEVQPTEANHAQLVTNIVSAYVSNNSVRTSDLPELIASVHAALTGLGTPSAPAEDQVQKLTPAQIRKSITPDALISFIDGKSYKTLKRHLTMHGLDIQGYRIRYGLPSDYPSTSANYSAQRSELAKTLGLGQQRRNAASKAPPAPAEKPKGRGRPRKADEAAAAE